MQHMGRRLLYRASFRSKRYLKCRPRFSEWVYIIRAATIFASLFRRADCFYEAGATPAARSNLLTAVRRVPGLFVAFINITRLFASDI